MANIIDTSYFVGDIEIANAASQPEITTDVEHSIKIYEKEVLMDLLGYNLYKELQTWLATPVSGDKFYKLVNGEDFSFSVDGRVVNAHWDGLKGENKKSLIAYFVYFMHRRKRATYMAGTSQEVKPASENSTSVNLIDKLVDIWNEFVVMYGDECDYFYSWNDLQNSYHSNDAPSAFNYLLAKKDDFPNWRFKDQGGEINIFGI